MKAVIDRFEGDYAILLFEEDDVQIDFPKKLLPEDINEGDVITFHIAVNAEETEDRKKNAQNLLEKLNRKNKL